jgi:hypothetical protein
VARQLSDDLKLRCMAWTGDLRRGSVQYLGYSIGFPDHVCSEIRQSYLEARQTG